MMKYVYPILLYIYQIYTTMAIYIHGLLMLTSCHFPGPATHNLAEPFGHVRRAQKKREEGGIDGAMIGDFLETPWLINIWRYHLVLIGVGSFLPDMLSMNQLGAHME